MIIVPNFIVMVIIMIVQLILKYKESSKFFRKPIKDDPYISMTTQLEKKKKITPICLISCRWYTVND